MGWIQSFSVFSAFSSFRERPRGCNAKQILALFKILVFLVGKVRIVAVA